MINWSSAKSILELGSGIGLSTLYLTVAYSDISCLSVELDSAKSNVSKNLLKEWTGNVTQSTLEFPTLEEKQDCIFVNLINYKVESSELIIYLLSLVKEDSFIIIDGIRTNKRHQMLWKELISNDQVIVSLDLYHLGILFFDKKYYKRNYKLSF